MQHKKISKFSNHNLIKFYEKTNEKSFRELYKKTIKFIANTCNKRKKKFNYFIFNPTQTKIRKNKQREDQLSPSQEHRKPTY